MLPDLDAYSVLNYLQNPTPDDGVALDLLLHDNNTPLMNIDPKQTLDPNPNDPLTTPLNVLASSNGSLHGGVSLELVPKNSLSKPILVEQKTTQVSSLCSINMASGHWPPIDLRHRQEWQYRESSEANLF